MTTQRKPEGTPSKDEVEHDFTVPDDADLRPVAETGAEAHAEDEA